MREIRPSGSAGGEAGQPAFPTPIWSIRLLRLPLPFRERVGVRVETFAAANPSFADNAPHFC
jgi:hypothetical protein